MFPDNEVRKGQLTMQLKRLRETQETLAWPSDNSDLPVISWDSCQYSCILSCLVSVRLFLVEPSVQEQSQKRPLILISGFIHDVSDFVSEHPGGAHLLIKMIGKDATTAFFGGVYDHSNAAHNVCFYPLKHFTRSNTAFLSVVGYEARWCAARWSTTRSGG